jgi:hypothetical protein
VSNLERRASERARERERDACIESKRRRESVCVSDRQRERESQRARERRMYFLSFNSSISHTLTYSLYLSLAPSLSAVSNLDRRAHSHSLSLTNLLSVSLNLTHSLNLSHSLTHSLSAVSNLVRQAYESAREREMQPTHGGSPAQATGI